MNVSLMPITFAVSPQKEDFNRSIVALRPVISDLSIPNRCELIWRFSHHTGRRTVPWKVLAECNCIGIYLGSEKGNRTHASTHFPAFFPRASNSF
jgi:hypothetical protein